MAANDSENPEADPTVEAAATAPDAATVAVPDADATAGTEAATRARPTPVARLYEEEQRIDGRFRWSVGGAQRSCRACRESIPPHTSFSTVLMAALPEDLPGVAGPDPLEVFERCDYCEACFEALPNEQVFAHWKSCFPTPEAEPKKQVNLASLRSYFDQVAELIHAPAVDEPPAADPEAADPESDLEIDADLESRDDSRAEDSGDAEGDDSSAQAETPEETSGAFAYLLALFLVRRRLLKWGGFTDAGLRLICRQTDREYCVAIPQGSESALTAQIGAFEELFQ